MLPAHTNIHDVCTYTCFMHTTRWNSSNNITRSVRVSDATGWLLGNIYFKLSSSVSNWRWKRSLFDFFISQYCLHAFYVDWASSTFSSFGNYVRNNMPNVQQLLTNLRRFEMMFVIFPIVIPNESAAETIYVGFRELVYSWYNYAQTLLKQQYQNNYKWLWINCVVQHFLIEKHRFGRSFSFCVVLSQPMSGNHIE